MKKKRVLCFKTCFNSILIDLYKKIFFFKSLHFETMSHVFGYKSSLTLYLCLFNDEMMHYGFLFLKHTVNTSRTAVYYIYHIIFITKYYNGTRILQGNFVVLMYANKSFYLSNKFVHKPLCFSNISTTTLPLKVLICNYLFI